MKHAWPRAIAHVDGDAFFVACEQAVNPALRGKPVVVGADRKIILAASYEAKALGIQRGVPLWEAQRRYPHLIVLPSNYELYSVTSQRLMALLGDFSPLVEAYSVDEAFVDLTGLDRLYRTDYPTIAAAIQEHIQRELGICVSVGVSLTKTLAKAASEHRKPGGFVAVDQGAIPAFLRTVPVNKVWNIGPQTTKLLRRYGVHTAADFVSRPREWWEGILHQPGIDIWRELTGEAVLGLDPAPKESYQSMSRIRTFNTPSTDRAYVYAQLLRNLESLGARARRHRLAPKKMIIKLRWHWPAQHLSTGAGFKSSRGEVKLTRPSAFPLELLPDFRRLFDQLYQPGVAYRATTVEFADLVDATTLQPRLFPEHSPVRWRALYAAVDRIQEKYDKGTIQSSAVALAPSPTVTGFSDTPLSTRQCFL